VQEVCGSQGQHTCSPCTRPARAGYVYHKQLLCARTLCVCDTHAHTCTHTRHSPTCALAILSGFCTSRCSVHVSALPVVSCPATSIDSRSSRSCELLTCAWVGVGAVQGWGEGLQAARMQAADLHLRGIPCVPFCIRFLDSIRAGVGGWGVLGRGDCSLWGRGVCGMGSSRPPCTTRGSQTRSSAPRLQGGRTFRSLGSCPHPRFAAQGMHTTLLETAATQVCAPCTSPCTAPLQVAS